AIAATPELEATEPRIHDALRRFEDRLNALQPAEMEAVIEAATRALSPAEEPVPPIVEALSGGRRPTAAERVEALSGGRRPTAAERVEAEIDVLMRSFARRRELLAGALTASQVARLLGTSRQTP